MHIAVETNNKRSYLKTLFLTPMNGSGSGVLTIAILEKHNGADCVQSESLGQSLILTFFQKGEMITSCKISSISNFTNKGYNITTFLSKHLVAKISKRTLWGKFQKIIVISPA